MSRSRTIAVATVLLLAAGGGWTWFALGNDAGADAAVDAVASVARTTATVQSRDMVTTASLDGTLTYAGASAVTAARSGTVTWLPDVGSIVEPGGVLYRVDDEPVILLPGSLPQWRALDARSSDGADILQLERALVDLGHATDETLTVDEAFTSATGDAIATLREAVGLDAGEAIGMGEVFWGMGSLRVSGLQVAVGDRLGGSGPVLQVSSPERVVSVVLDASDQGVVAEGDDVTVELPDGTQVEATVTFVSDVARAVTSGGNQPTTSYVLDVEVTLVSGGDGFDEAPVDVIVVDSLAEGVLAVPVEALLALAEGGYALEVVDAGGATHLVAVELGTFADGWVEVAGAEVVEGLEVVSA